MPQKNDRQLKFIMAVCAYQPAIHEGIHRFCRANGIKLSVRYNYLQEFYEGPIDCDGLIVNVKTEDHKLIETMSQLEKPVVVINKRCGLPFLVVKEDDRLVGVKAAEYYLEKGLRKFVFFTRESWGTVAGTRFEGFKEVLRQHGFTVMPYYLRPDANEKSLNDLLKMVKGSDETVGCFCSDDAAAVNLVEAVEGEGIAVPDKLCILGAGNNSKANWTDMPLSSVELNFEEIGYKAGELLLKIIDGNSVDKDQPILIEPGMIIERESSAVILELPEILHQGMEFIRSNYFRKDLTLELIAENCGSSIRKFQNLTKKHLGKTPSKLIQEVRVEQAKKLLSSENYPLDYIAAECGFSSAQYFITVFKKLTGQTPHEFRRFV